MPDLDYAELVKALRHCIITIPCDGCPYYSHGDKPSKECSTMNFSAADAIEELLAELVTLRNRLPQWIRVEERLPEFVMNNSGCVCTTKLLFRTEHKTIHIGYAIRTYHNIETVEGYECIVVDRWYDQSGDMIEDVTHWMPLPAPPKGVE